MPYRMFEDSAGSEWQVWDVVPYLSELRNGAADRRVATIVIPFADRRRDVRRLASMRRMVLSGSYAQGWLCFDNGAEKRRLTPIPSDWMTCVEERLEAYLRSSARVAGPYGGHRKSAGDDSIART